MMGGHHIPVPRLRMVVNGKRMVIKDEREAPTARIARKEHNVSWSTDTPISSPVLKPIDRKEAP